jgi:uncharacterized protein (TIGR02145 family)
MRRFRLYLSFPVAAALAAGMVACGGDGSTEVTQERATVVSDTSKLPDCTKDNEGELAFVNDDGSMRVCVKGEWKSSSDSDNDFSCKTEELKDKSGLKIICNGDSVGVVKNGTNGENGASSEGCSVTAQTDSTVTIACGKETTTIPLGSKTPIEEDDPERQPTSMESLVGYTQKGPFVRGSTVYLYELESGRTLKQTNGNFTSNILSDDGRYRFLARDLVSQYAMLVVDGNYRNEVTGKVSGNTIRLKAFTDLSKHTSANVNLLTHLEFERVYYLVTKMKKKLYEAKAQAQGEILDIFHIKLKDKTDAEDMNVFGDGDADAALLAISILLQGDRTEADLMALLAEISDEIAEKGVWEGKRADSIKASIADWALKAYLSGNLATFRKNVEQWNLGPVPPFEKHINKFWSGELMPSLGTCGDESNPVGTNKVLSDKNSDYNGAGFICGETGWYPGFEYEGKIYRTVKINSLLIMAENLNYETENSFCYADDPVNCSKYGRLYTWAAAMGKSEDECGSADHGCELASVVQGICPEGWHIPTSDEWLQGLIRPFWSGERATAMKLLAKDNTVSLDEANNSSGFSAFLSGYRRDNEQYVGFRNETRIWSSSQNSFERDGEEVYIAMDFQLSTTTPDVGMDPKKTALSVRCVKD